MLLSNRRLRDQQERECAEYGQARVVKGVDKLNRQSTLFVVGSEVARGCGVVRVEGCAGKRKCHKGGLPECCESNAERRLPW